MKEYINTIIKSILAGLMISIASVIFVTCQNKFVGAFLFAIGLISIIEFQFNLYTGKIAYIFNVKKPKEALSNILNMICIYFGNLIGTMFTTIFTDIDTTEMIASKLSTPLLTVFGKGVMCGILIYIAVEGCKNANGSFYDYMSRYLFTIICIPAFILGGAEHCIADLCYLNLASAYDINKAITFIAVVTLGNSVGSILIHTLRKFKI